MANESSTIVQKLWNYCNVLRDDGVSYSDYVEQLTYLLFLKMADEQTTLLGKPSTIPSEYNWQSLRSQDGDALEIQYRIFWLRDESLEDSDNLPEPDVLAQDIAEDLGAALALFKSISEDLEVEAEVVN